MESVQERAPAVVQKPIEWLPAERFRVEFDRCWPWLDGAIARFGRTHEKHHLLEELTARRGVYFFSMPNCAAVCRVNAYPTGLREVHVWLVGGNLREIRDGLYPKIEAWGKRMGCHRMIAYGRKGWLRALYGWMSHGTTRVKSLMGPQPTEIELKFLGYTELRDDDGC